jgi:hypothetical protein
MGAEPQWNDIDKVKPKNLGKILSQCHFVHRKPYMDPELRTFSIGL